VRVPSSLRGDLLVWFKAGDDEVHLFTDDEGAGSSAQHLCLQVDDLPALLDRLSETDIEIDREPTPIQNRPRCFLRDPFGNLIELTQITGDYS
jgi:catechol 2,3-dioxygenase-like lactoylglutathione lyase family enzyme